MHKAGDPKEGGRAEGQGREQGGRAQHDAETDKIIYKE